MSKTTTLHVHHAFCIFLCRPCPTTTWNDQILSWLENGNGRAINFAFSLWIRTWSPLFSSNLTSLLSSDWVTWYKGEKVLKDAKSISQRRFHWRRLLSDRNVPNSELKQQRRRRLWKRHFNSSNVGNIFWKRKGKLLSCVPVLNKTWN